jgi:elongation factor P hydroxylase
MLTNNLRWIIVGMATVLIGIAIYNQEYQAAAIAGLGVGYLIWSYVREGTVFLATQAFQRKDYAKTQSLLDQIKRPERLRKKRRNYYEFMRGNLALQSEDYQAAEHHFQIASRLPFRRSNDKAIILVHLANINLRKKDYERVRAYLEVVRKLEVTSRIAQIINRIENEIPKEKK